MTSSCSPITEMLEEDAMLASQNRSSAAVKSLLRLCLEGAVWASLCSAITSCGHELLFSTDLAVKTRTADPNRQQGGRSAEEDAEKRGLVASESRDGRFSLFAEQTELPFQTNTAVGFRTDVTFLGLSRDTSARFRAQCSQLLQVFSSDGGLAHQKKAKGGSAEWSMPELEAGHYQVRLTLSIDENPGLDLPQPLEFSYIVDRTPPTLDLSFIAQDSTEGQAGNTVALLELSSIDADLSVCDPAEIVFSGMGEQGSTDSQAAALRLVALQEVTAHGAAGTSRLWRSEPFPLDTGLSGPAERTETAAKTTYAARLKCTDQAGNSSTVSAGFETEPVAVALRLEGALEPSGASAMARVPFEGGEPTWFIASDSLTLRASLAVKGGAHDAVGGLESSEEWAVAPQALLDAYGSRLLVWSGANDPMTSAPDALVAAALEPGRAAAEGTIQMFAPELIFPIGMDEQPFALRYIALVYHAADGSYRILSAQKIRVQRDTEALSFVANSAANRAVMSSGADLVAGYTASGTGAPLVTQWVESSSDGVTWIPETTAGVVRVSGTNNYEITVKSRFATEVPFRVRISGVDAAGNTFGPVTSQPLTWRSDLEMRTQLEVGQASQSCAAPLAPDQAAPQLDLLSRMVCHESAKNLEAAPYVRLLLGISNLSYFPFLIDPAQKMTFRVVSSSGLSQSLSIPISQLQGKVFADGFVKLLFPVNAALLQEDRVWIEWDGESMGYFDDQRTCAPPTGGRPRLVIKDTTQGETPVFDPFGC